MNVLCVSDTEFWFKFQLWGSRDVRKCKGG